MKFLCTQIFLLRMFQSSVSESRSYIDPLTGSVIVQAILGGLAGVGVAMKMYWHRFTEFFGRRSNQTGTDE